MVFLVQVPGLAVSFLPNVAVPLIFGVAPLTGGSVTVNGSDTLRIASLGLSEPVSRRTLWVVPATQSAATKPLSGLALAVVGKGRSTCQLPSALAWTIAQTRVFGWLSNGLIGGVFGVRTLSSSFTPITEPPPPAISGEIQPVPETRIALPTTTASGPVAVAPSAASAVTARAGIDSPPRPRTAATTIGWRPMACRAEPTMPRRHRRFEVPDSSRRLSLCLVLHAGAVVRGTGSLDTGDGSLVHRTAPT